jgi:hypothetical protein
VTKATAVSFADELCAATKPHNPWIALLLAGNFRTFSDPRVYKTIRANLVDALGAQVVTFIYGKLQGEHKPEGLKGDSLYDSLGHQNAEAQRVKIAIDYLKQDDRVVVAKIVNRTPEVIEKHCPAFNRKSGSEWMEKTYIGQLQSTYAAYEMLEEYETTHPATTFLWVIKARLDAMWLRSVQPWCTYRTGTAYIISPAPVDWFMLLPGTIAKRTMTRPFLSYRGCGRSGDAGEYINNSADCCGGGPSAQFMGEIYRARVPVIGPKYEGSKWGPPPTGSREMSGYSMWQVLVMRTAVNQHNRNFCSNLFLYSGPQPYFPSQSICREVIEAEEMRRKFRIF